MQKTYHNIILKYLIIIINICFYNYYCYSENLELISKNIFESNDSTSLFNKNYFVAFDEKENIIITKNEQNIKYIPENDFIYADTKRYILIGGLPQAETKIKLLPATIFGTALTGIFILQHQMQMKTIWKEHSDNFKIMDDLKQELYLDKIGHIYGAYISSYFLREALVASGLSWNASNNIAAGLGFAYSTYVEILDGYGENWGFSPSDFICDIVGGLFFAAQNYIPILQNITPKFIYIPSEWTGYKSRIPHDMFIDDYSSQFFFYSINIYNLLPESWKKYYPNWLELSVGYTVRNMLDANRSNEIPCFECIEWEKGYWGSPRLVLALDYNLVKLLPDGNNTWNWLKQTLNFFKLPSPALEIGKITRFYILFPFKLW